MLGYKLQSPLSRRRRRLKAAAALISNPLYLPNGGNEKNSPALLRAFMQPSLRIMMTMMMMMVMMMMIGG